MHDKINQYTLNFYVRLGPDMIHDLSRYQTLAKEYFVKQKFIPQELCKTYQKHAHFRRRISKNSISIKLNIWG